MNPVCFRAGVLCTGRSVFPLSGAGFVDEGKYLGSLTEWLDLNVDPAASMAIGQLVDSTGEGSAVADWRLVFYEAVRRWERMSHSFAGRASEMTTPDGRSCSLSPDETGAYIEWISCLLRFAEEVLINDEDVEVLV